MIFSLQPKMANYKRFLNLHLFYSISKSQKSNSTKDRNNQYLFEFEICNAYDLNGLLFILFALLLLWSFDKKSFKLFFNSVSYEIAHSIFTFSQRLAKSISKISFIKFIVIIFVSFKCFKDLHEKLTFHACSQSQILMTQKSSLKSSNLNITILKF